MDFDLHVQGEKKSLSAPFWMKNASRLDSKSYPCRWSRLGRSGHKCSRPRCRLGEGEGVLRRSTPCNSLVYPDVS